MTVVPAVVTVAGLAVLVSVSAGVWVAKTVSVAGSEVTAALLGAVPVAWAVLVTFPASMSAWVIV